MHETVYVGWKDRAGPQVFRLEGGRAFSMQDWRTLAADQVIAFDWGNVSQGTHMLALALAADALLNPNWALALECRLQPRLTIHLRTQEWCLTEARLRGWMEKVWLEAKYDPAALAWREKTATKEGGEA